MGHAEHSARAVGAALGALLLALSALPAGASELRAFGPQSYDQILEAHRGRPFVLVFWSVDCVPCLQELALLGTLAAEHPSLELVLVSTDGRAIAREVTAALAEHGLGAAEAWVFDAPPEHLRHAVDPAWYGTVPRTYLFDTAHRRQAVSGAMTRESIERWLGEHTP